MKKKNFFKKEERPDFYSLLIDQCDLNDEIMTLFISYMAVSYTHLASDVRKKSP